MFNFLPKDDKFFDQLDTIARVLVSSTERLWGRESRRTCIPWADSQPNSPPQPRSASQQSRLYISTTHAIGGAVSGVGATRGAHAVRWIWGQRIVGLAPHIPRSRRNRRPRLLARPLRPPTLHPPLVLYGVRRPGAASVTPSVRSLRIWAFHAPPLPVPQSVSRLNKLC